ncbi:hypothetical protein, partial [Yersinia rohdei]|uniref:hypothetical protein n=1 Tax=Yersinia rohdei TaxID=29485 RepID=UPI001C96770E
MLFISYGRIGTVTKPLKKYDNFTSGLTFCSICFSSIYLGYFMVEHEFDYIDFLVSSGLQRQ